MKTLLKKSLSIFMSMAIVLSLMTGIPFSELDLGITASADIIGQPELMAQEIKNFTGT